MPPHSPRDRWHAVSGETTVLCGSRLHRSKQDRATTGCVALRVPSTDSACGDQQRCTCVDVRLRVRNRLANELRFLTNGSDVDRELKAGGSRDLEQRLDLWVLLTGL